MIFWEVFFFTSENEVFFFIIEIYEEIIYRKKLKFIFTTFFSSKGNNELPDK